MNFQPVPSKYGRRLLPTVVDDAARIEPDRVLFHTPRNDQPSQGYEIVTAKVFANSINRVCWWLKSKLGPKRESRTIGYIGHNDLRYFLIMLAAAKIGHRLLLSSPRNSTQGHKSLNEQSGCELWIVSSGIDNIPFIRSLDIRPTKIPELSQLLQHSDVEPYPYNKEWSEGKTDVLALLHTSGSTGLPKLVPMRLASASAVDAFHLMEPTNGKMPTGVEWMGTKMLCAMPLFHVAGICLGLFSSVFFKWSVVLPSTGPIMQHVIEDALDNIHLDSAFISPSVLQDISKSPRVLEKLSKLKFVTSAGGPVAQSVGDVIHPRTPIWQTMGMTEGMWVASVVTHRDEWAYYYFHPRTGSEMRPYSNSLFELVFVKREELASTQPVFVTFPELDEWETKDLYSRHPDIPNLWKYEMRRDDVIVLANGEKFNPLGAEGQLIGHPSVSAAYITGRGRFQAAALLYVDKSMASQDELTILDVWPTIEHINASLPAFAQLHRDFIKIVFKPFPRTPKGTLARNETEELFSAEIEEIYGRATEIKSSLHFNVISQEALRDGIKDAIRTVSGMDQLDDGDNIFGRGFDSLHVIRLTKLLNSAFNQPMAIEVGTIYGNPTIAQLSSALLNELQQVSQGNKPSASELTSAMLAKHSPFFESSREVQDHVVITGTTGEIGAYLLNTLCNTDQVAKIWCLNRSSNAQQKQTDLAVAKGLTPDWRGKAQFIQYDLSSTTLGLSEEILEEIKDKSTVVIHNAWEVNFNLPLSSFEPQFTGLKNLVEICGETRHKNRFYFVSSISAAMNWPSELLGPVPEAKIPSFDAPINGYGASKLVAEHLLSRAARSGALSLSVLRVGQVAGPVMTHGEGSMWTRRDWLPAIIDASAHLRMLPSDLGSASDLDWIPVDLLAEIIGQLIRPGLSENVQEAYFNLVNPKPSSWSHVLPSIKARIEKTLSADVKIVPLQRWIYALRDTESLVLQKLGDGSTCEEDRIQTALKLIPFFQMLAGPEINGYAAEQKWGSGTSSKDLQWAISNSSSQSSVFCELSPVSQDWFETWLRQWGY